MEISTISDGVLIEEPRRIRFADAPSRARRVVEDGDTIVSTVRPYLKAVWFADNTYEDLVCSTGFAVLTPRWGTAPKYLGYMVQSSSFTNQMTANSVGTAYPAISEGKFGSLQICVPPLPEQHAIARYLDHVDRGIQRYIDTKEKLIALLQEARQATIQRAVTRGLNPDVPLKPSGVDWLGDVPAHWEVRKLRYLAHITTGERDTVDRKDDGKYPFFVRSQTVERIDTWSYDGEAVLTAGDGVGVGKVFHYVNGKFDFHQRVYKFCDFGSVIGKFFFHYFKAMLRFEVLQGTAKSTVDSLRLPMLQNLPVAIPPHPEQRAIAAHLDKATDAIDAAIDTARRQADLMREYRASLIAHVVTGKLDVRAAAEHLPPEYPEQ
ncbi:MAG: restriction endonuclease subunit S [Caldilineaceae bacterium]|nr:restriction endonuclease subunit S [Caldilineaceae bacterium]